MLRSIDIKKRALDLGFHKIGIVPAEPLEREGRQLMDWLVKGYHGKMEYMSREPEKRSDPKVLMPSAKSVICVALNYYQNDSANSENTGEHDSNVGKISRYAWGDDYHDVLKDKLRELMAWIMENESEIESKICVDTAPIMDKAWAVRAGIGWLGKHSNVITKEYGSWIFLGELLLSIELEYDDYIEPDHCGKCTACIDACPTQAIVAPYQVDGTRCISYGTIELRDEELPEPIASNLNDWIFGCDICQDVCPWSRFSKQTNELRFNAREGISSLNLQELTDLANLTQDEFSIRFRKSAIKRTKVSGIRRNANAALKKKH